MNLFNKDFRIEKSKDLYECFIHIPNNTNVHLRHNFIKNWLDCVKFS